MFKSDKFLSCLFSSLLFGPLLLNSLLFTSCLLYLHLFVFKLPLTLLFSSSLLVHLKALILVKLSRFESFMVNCSVFINRCLFRPLLPNYFRIPKRYVLLLLSKVVLVKGFNCLILIVITVLFNFDRGNCLHEGLVFCRCK